MKISSFYTHLCVALLFTSTMAHALVITSGDLDDPAFTDQDTGNIDTTKWFSLASSSSYFVNNDDNQAFGTLNTEAYAFISSPNVYFVTMEVNYSDEWFIMGQENLTKGDSIFTGFPAILPSGSFSAGWSFSEADSALLSPGSDAFIVSTDVDDILSFTINVDTTWNPNHPITFYYTTVCFGGETKCVSTETYNFTTEQFSATGVAVVPEPSTIGLIVAGLLGLGFVKRKRAA